MAEQANRILWDPDAVDQFERALAFIDQLRGMTGPGVTVSPFGITIGLPQRRSRRTPIASGGVRVKVTGSATGGGKYTGRILTDPTTATTASGDLAESDIGTVPSADDCLILNTREVGKNTHDLASSGFLPLIFLGDVVNTSDQGLTVVVIDGFQWEVC